MLVFSLDNRDSYEEVIRLRETILETHMAAWHAAGPKRPPHPPRVPMVIAGNKADIEPRSVSEPHRLALHARPREVLVTAWLLQGRVPGRG